jgi:hypothetical protein
MKANDLTGAIIGAAIEVRRSLGPGLLESAYFAPIHDAQWLTYLRLGGWKIGLLINFNVPVLRQGIRRKVLGLEESSGELSESSAPLR